jgi:pentatricopeptide repeat protein
MQSKGIQPSFRTYGSLLEMYERTGEVAKAKKVVDDMVANDHVFDMRMYHKLITLYANLGDWVNVEKYFNQVGKCVK